MRPVILTDVTRAARTLLALPKDGWHRALRDGLDRADVADRYRRATRKPHPDWGNGSLSDALSASPRRPEPALSDPLYREALIAVLGALHDPHPCLTGR